MTNLKLTLHHMIGGTESGKLLAHAPAGIVLVGDLGLGVQASPSTVVFGRLIDDHWLDNQGFDMNRYFRQGQNPVELAGKYVLWMKPQILANPWVAVWKGPNEMVFEHDEEQEAADPKLKAANTAARRKTMDWYARFEAERARLLHTLYGKRAALGSWPAENPLREHGLWPWWTPALQAIKDYNGFNDRHDYAGFAPDGGLRVVYDNQEFAKLGFPDLPAIISECGMDQVSWIPNSAGWRQYFKGSMQRYWNELLLPYANAIAAFDFIKCAAIFTDGGGGGDGWPVHDVTGTDIVARLAAWKEPVVQPAPAATMARGQDVAGDNQPLSGMRYSEWAKLGFCFGWVEWVRSGKAVPDAAKHRAAMRTERYLTGAYANLAHGNAGAQCYQLLSWLHDATADELGDMLDCENGNLTAADVIGWCDVHDGETNRRLDIYTSANRWNVIMRGVPAATLARFKRYGLVVAGYPNDTPATLVNGQLVDVQPMDAASVAHRSTPPALSLLASYVPAPWNVADVVSWQHTGHGSLPGYNGFLDLHVATMTQAQMRAKFAAAPGVPPVVIVPPTAPTLFGVHGRADGRQAAADIEVMRVARAEAVFLLSSAAGEDVDTLGQLQPTPVIMVRCFADFTGRVVPAADFVHWMSGDLVPFYQRGIRDFQIHNEPNLKAEGWGSDPAQAGSWADGAAFAVWFVSVRDALNEIFPGCRWGWPGLSPGLTDHAAGRYDSELFMADGVAGVAAADWIGMHCYFQNEQQLADAVQQVRLVRAGYPGKPIYITEFSNPGAEVPDDVRAARYLEFVPKLNGLARAAFAYVASASNTQFAAECWRDETGKLSAVPALVGARVVGDDDMPITRVRKQAMHDALTVIAAGVSGVLAEIDALVVDDAAPAAGKHTMAKMTNQAIINLFNAQFGGLTLLEAQLTPTQLANLYVKNPANGQRDTLYTGPAVEDMPHLSAGQKVQVIAALPLG